jgi:hypothetical protein
MEQTKHGLIYEADEDDDDILYQSLQNTSLSICLSNNQQMQNLTLHVVLYGYDSWSLILRKNID